jgi:hypothetical protein
MKMHRNFRYLLLSGAALSLAAVLMAQTTPEKTLVVNGKSAGTVVREFDGHTYIEIEALARATNGTVTIEPNRVLLTMPVGSSAATVAASAQAVQPPPGLSTEFKRAAISELAEMREWRGAVGAMITYGLAAGSATAQDYHAICEEGLNQATVVATTDADHSALRLLRNEFDNLSAWANQILTERKSLNAARTIDPNSMQNDAALTKINNCGRFLNTMIVSGAFNDDSSCH